MSYKAIIASVLAAAVVVRAAPATYYGDGQHPKSPLPHSMHYLQCLILATYYYPNGGLGACGSPIQNTDYIVALSPDQYAGGANCYRHIGVHC